VRYKLTMGAFKLDVNWGTIKGSGKVTKDEIDASGIFELGEWAVSGVINRL
jgi:hypothetical protein